MISVVVPIFNEQENLSELRQRLTAALETTHQDWEVIFIDDGSRDRSLEILRGYAAQDPRLNILSLSRNFGHQPAITAGIHHSRGDCVILIDGDLQDPPEIIPQLVERWTQGFHIVLAERISRQERKIRGFGFRLFYPIFRRLSDMPTQPDAGIFGLMDRAVVDEFNKLPERNRYIPGLRGWLGFTRTSIFYDRQARAAGKPKQTLRRLIRYAIDGMFSFSYKPLRWVTYTGLMVSGITFVLAMYYFATFFLFHKQSGSGFTTIIMCVLFLGGIQLISIGILGEYIGRIYDEIKQRPLYVVQEKIGFASATPSQHSAIAPTTASDTLTSAN